MPPSSSHLGGGQTETKNAMQSCHSLLRDSSFHALLLEIDEDLAARTRQLGCAFCNGVLHRADYPRKPRGIGAEDHARFSFCCNREGCRRRATPPSVRFLGRRIYLGVVVVLVTALRQGPSPRRSRVLAEEFKVDERTIRRWRHWWRETFPETIFWKEARARFMPSVTEGEIPSSLVRQFGRLDCRDALLRFLTFLSPLPAPRHLVEEFSRIVRAVLDTQKLSSHSLDVPR